MALSVSLVIEILGRPEEHVKTALSELVEKLSKEKGVKIKNKNIHEPIKAENSKDLFTTFAEIDLEIDNITTYIGIVFAYLPSHIEITSPEKLTITNHDINELGIILTQRIHSYDSITKNILVERDIFMQEIQKHSPELFNKIISNMKKPKN